MVTVSAVNKFQFILFQSHMRPAKGKGLIRWATRKEVRRVFEQQAQSITCTRGRKDPEPISWEIFRLEDGSFRVGCLLFSPRAVSKIRKWAGVK